MSEVVLVALITVLGTLIATSITQWLAARAAREQLLLTERREATAWERSETQRKSARKLEMLREMWEQSLDLQDRIHGISARVDLEQIITADQPLPTAASMKVVTIAALGLVDLKSLADQIHHAVVILESAAFFNERSEFQGALEMYRPLIFRLEEEMCTMAQELV